MNSVAYAIVLLEELLVGSGELGTSIVVKAEMIKRNR